MSDTGDVISEYAVASREDVDGAIAAAARAFPVCSRTNALHRFEILDRIDMEVSARSGEIGDMLAREEGKVLKEASAEVLRAGQVLKFSSAEADRAKSDGLPSVRDQGNP